MYIAPKLEPPLRLPVLQNMLWRTNTPACDSSTYTPAVDPSSEWLFVKKL